MVSRAEKFEEFRKTKQVFYVKPWEFREQIYVPEGSPEVSPEDEEWYQKGFGGEVYLGTSETEAFEKFDEHMDEREAAFLGFVKGFVTA